MRVMLYTYILVTYVQRGSSSPEQEMVGWKMMNSEQSHDMCVKRIIVINARRGRIECVTQSRGKALRERPVLVHHNSCFHLRHIARI